MKKLTVLVSLALISMGAFAQDGYVTDVRGDFVKSGSGLCWRTGSWTPAKAVKGCDPDLLSKDEVVLVEKKVVDPVKPIASKKTLSADTLFDFNKSTLTIIGISKIADVVLDIKKLNLEVVLVVGHADRFGSDQYNDKLSLARANSVKLKLKELGVEESKIYVEGKGKRQPILAADECSGKKSAITIACLAPERRVDIEVIGTSK